MRELATFTDEQQSRRFTAYLAVQAIQVSADEDDGRWVIWVHDDDDREQALAYLEEFQQDPNHERYENAERKVRHVLKEADRLQKENSKRQVKLKQRWSGSWWHCHPASYILIGICIAVSGLCSTLDGKKSQFGLPRLCNKQDSQLLQKLWILDSDVQQSWEDNINNRWEKWQNERLAAGVPLNELPEVPSFMEWRQLYAQAALASIIEQAKTGEVWRVITPAFIHMDVLHILFNMMWLRALGTGIEFLRGTKRFLLLCLILAVTSHLAELFWSSPHFGGMSGVVFGLIGYAWMKGKTKPSDGIALRQQTVVYCMFWMVMCMSGALGAIANAAHGGGLVVGMLIGARQAIWKKLPFTK